MIISKRDLFYRIIDLEMQSEVLEEMIDELRDWVSELEKNNKTKKTTKKVKVKKWKLVSKNINRIFYGRIIKD